MCDDDCPHCGARHMSPTESDNLTAVFEPRWGVFAVYVSTDTADCAPNYELTAVFLTLAEAEAYAGGARLLR